MPVADPTVAIAVLLLLHTPPAGVLVSVSEVPWQKSNVPPIAVGTAFTVIVCVAVAVPHTVVTAYDIVAVPAAMPLTTPEVPVVATATSDDDHTPPVVPSVSVMSLPVHTAVGPVIVPAAGNGFIVTIWLLVQPVDV
jgi:hypothetical protein